MYEHQCQLFVKPIETIRNQIKSLFSKFLYKIQNISQNPKHDLDVLKTKNTTKSKAWHKVSSKMIPKLSLYKIINLFGDDSRYPAISHKQMLCAKRQRVRFCRGFFWAMSNQNRKVGMTWFPNWDENLPADIDLHVHCLGSKFSWDWCRFSVCVCVCVPKK